MKLDNAKLTRKADEALKNGSESIQFVDDEGKTVKIKITSIKPQRICY